MPAAKGSRPWNAGTPIMDRIENLTMPIPECGCYVWMGTLADGYGRIKVSGGMRQVHRVAYEQLVGPIPDGLTLDHLCRVRSCWRPDHLEPATNRENVLRGICPAAVNARKTHCKRGHPLSGNNLFLEGDNKRRCRECRRLFLRSAEYRAYRREHAARLAEKTS